MALVKVFCNMLGKGVVRWGCRWREIYLLLAIFTDFFDSFFGLSFSESDGI
jgi:hypothetical protein